MYADDTVIFSETIDGLQYILNSLETYFTVCKLQVTVKKNCDL